jgi:hypothetical protein
VRLSHRTQNSSCLLLAGTLIAAALVSGCSSTIHGKPVASVPGTEATEPSYPKTRPSAPSPATPSKPAPPGPTLPGGAISLPPDQNGYVFIETKSGQARCQIDADNVGCQAPFTNSPIQDGEHANGINITASGSVQWVLGNIGDMPAVTIDYRTYHAAGWTIAANEDGTRFTNDRTGHGMFVSIEHVDTY